MKLVQKPKSDKETSPRRKRRNYQPDLDTGYSWTYVLSNKSAEEETDIGWLWLMSSVTILIGFLKRKSDQTHIMLIWIRSLSKKNNFEIKRIRLDNSSENRNLQKNVTKLILELPLSSQHQVHPNRTPALMGRARAMLV